MSTEGWIYSIVFALSILTIGGFLLIGIRRIAHAVTAKPLHYIMLCLSVVAALGIGIKNLSFEPDMKQLLPENCRSRQVWSKIYNIFGGLEGVYICVSANEGTIWNPQVLSQIHSICQDLKTAGYVDNVLSITEAKSIRNDHDMMSVADIVPSGDLIKTAQQAAAIEAKVKANDLLFKKLVSKDEKSTLIVITVNTVAQTVGPDGKPSQRLIRDADILQRLPGKPDEPTVMNVMARHECPASTLRLTGFPYVRYDNQERMQRDNIIFLSVGLVVMLGFLYASFRTLRGMLLPLGIVVLGLIASFGFMGWMHEKITLPMVLMGPMLIAIAHNYGTQLIAKYYEDVQEFSGAFTPAALQGLAAGSIISIGSPVLISAVTVIVGFVTMISHPIRALALLGVLCAFGIVVSFILTIIMTPAILRLLPVPPMLVEKRHGAATDRLLGALARFTMRRKLLMLGFVLGLCALCVFFALRIRIDANMMNAYPRSSKIYQDADFISEAFGGYSTLNVLLEAKHPVADDAPDDGPIKNPEVLKWMEGFQRFALGLTDPQTGKRLVGQAISLPEQVAYMNRVMQDDPAQDRVPDTRALIAQYLLSFESQGGAGLSSIVDFKYNKTQMIFTLPDMSTARLATLNQDLWDYIRTHPALDLNISMGGSVEIVREIGDMIIEGQFWSLLLSFVIIVICYMLFFRSLAAGLLAAIPLCGAIALVFGLMGFFDIPLDTITATLTGISIGAGTDYTAYFLWRFRERAILHGSLDEGYLDTMTSIGKGILYNGLSVVVGFFVFLFSNFLPIRYFGFLISFSILACIVSTLTILPVVIFMTKPRFLLRTPSRGLGAHGVHTLEEPPVLIIDEPGCGGLDASGLAR